jgi:Arc/MetJ-type ribon-helix-helix transcriptional regulator
MTTEWTTSDLTSGFEYGAPFLLLRYYHGSIRGMKVSVSLPGEDVEFLDAYAHERGLDSRSAALHRAVRLLRASELAASYEAAWNEWSDAGEADAWDKTVNDGLQ